MEKHFTVACYPILDRKTALMFHKKLKMWLPPGGHIEKNELPSEAAKREVKEESNLEVKIISKKSGNFGDDDIEEEPLPFRIQVEFIPDPEGDHKHIDFVYAARVKEDTLEKNNESERIKWFSEKELDKLEGIKNNTRELAKKAIKIEKMDSEESLD